MSDEQNVTAAPSAIKAMLSEKSGHCETHGDFRAMVVLDGLAACPACEMVKIQRESAEDAKRDAKAMQSKKRRKRVENTNIPLRMMDKRWSDYIPANDRAAQFLQICKRYADEWEASNQAGANLIFSGKTGNGKTHLASVLCKQIAAENDAQPLYTTVSSMIRYIRAGFGKRSEYSEAQAIQRYVDADLLVIDEVGVKLSSEYDKCTLFEIIDERYQGIKPTAVISNLSVSEIEEHIDARLVDRLSDPGTLMLFDWESHRGKQS